MNLGSLSAKAQFPSTDLCLSFLSSVSVWIWDHLTQWDHIQVDLVSEACLEQVFSPPCVGEGAPSRGIGAGLDVLI